jgi:hypothetical protein
VKKGTKQRLFFIVKIDKVLADFVKKQREKGDHKKVFLNLFFPVQIAATVLAHRAI